MAKKYNKMNKEKQYKMGIDVGSTTIKIVVTDSNSQIIYKAYQRHQANIQQAFADELNKVIQEFRDSEFCINITGSAGMGIGERIGVNFVQEVVAAVEVVNNVYPETHTLIDLGGEDAKMVFFQEGKHPDIRMNGSCAGGTGAFIDQMANLMNITIEELGRQALNFEKIYPIASRCGVFAKTDVQNLISRNIPVADISASILHAVALQSVTTLARGFDVKPKVLCIGGPLTFIPALRNSFREVLKIMDNDFIVPDNGEFFPAWGAALYQDREAVFHNLNTLIEKSKNNTKVQSETLPALFSNENEYKEWKKNRKIKHLKFQELGSQKKIECFLGIDSGSTTTKIVIMDKEANIIYRFYDSNEGNPLKKVVEGLDKFYKEADEKGVKYTFLSSAATGYGEDLVKSALGLDYGIVETMAHLSGAQYVDPKVSFILDIGGQDIKSIFTENGIISNIELNEACSAGCGSFLQNFAATMNMSLEKFTEAACLAQYPSDLGSRCTVFMNSKVKQSLRENAGMDDIAAGLAYSVVKNCLYKVLKISNLKQLGDHIVVQGGTFRNDGVYRALELLSGKSVGSTDYPELMGALGAALYSRSLWEKENANKALSTKDITLPNPKNIDTKELQCKGCTNNCSVLRFKFENGNICYAGNKCEKIFYNKNVVRKGGYNGFDEKNEILFNMEVNPDNIRQGKTIGIPRVLNMFDNYPFWNTLLTECGFNVRLSPESTFPLYQKGVGGIMSDNICFPAKLVHGHILTLIEQKVDRIFYPIIPKEEKEFGSSSNSFNCPVVSGYPEVIRSSIEPEEKYGIPFDKPVITFSSDAALEKKCYEYLSSLGVSKKEFAPAFRKAMKVKTDIKIQLRENQKKLLEEAIENNEPAFVVAGRPYHADPLIHQKVGQILSDLGALIFTDDVFRKEESKGFGELNIISQWSYPNRVVQAAMEVAKLPQNVQLIQLNSFGCGPDSFFMDETLDILKKAGKNLTVLRIDEIASPGSIRLRLRSLVESLKTINTLERKKEHNEYIGYHRPYTKEDRKKTILIPWFTDFLSPFAPALGELAGYKVENLPKSNKVSADLGLMYGNNEVCYPSTLILGDIINTLQSGNYDLQDIVLAITQTGGQCRATNYLAQIKSGLQNAGFQNIPVIALSSGDSYQNDQSEFKLDWKKLINIAIDLVLYSDGLQQMHSSISVREKKKGASEEVFNFYIERGIDAVRANSPKTLKRLMKEAVADFNSIPIHERNYTKVGLIGEIFLKYNNYAQANITEWLRSKDVEVSTPPLLDFLLQFFVNSKENIKNGLDTESIMGKALKPLIWKLINRKINKYEAILKDFRFYEPSESIFAKAEAASEILSLSNQFGEGWMIAGEIAHYARKGVNKVVCIQPFGCIANHIVAKGVEKRLKTLYPHMNILYLDIDGGIAEVNLQNRLHFMIS